MALNARVFCYPAAVPTEPTGLRDVTSQFAFADIAHQHYEVAVFPTGSYWCPTSSHPPTEAWQGLAVPLVSNPPLPDKVQVFRPSDLYYWIPADKLATVKPGVTNCVINCNPPKNAPK